jgi:mannose-1-phosphate guanylyltransferase
MKHSIIYKVKTFTEKPNHEMANVFLKSGEFLWNSGMFIWTLKSIRSALKSNLEEVNNLFEAGKGKYNTPQEKQFIEDTYNDCKSISIDYGVMEKANNVYVVSASFGWSDLGTWTSLYLQSNKDEGQNVISGTTSLHNVKNSIVRVPREKLTVLGDLDGYLVVDTEDVLMVCKFDDENNFKQIVNNALLNSGNDKA